jgi:purine-cytosine permease-like protein
MDAVNRQNQGAGASNPIWNPNATSNWSILFTPLFGSYLQELNWRALGEPERAATSKRWFYASVGEIVVLFLLGLFATPENLLGEAIRPFAFIYLVTWYFLSGRRQATYVNERYGDGYTRRRWGRPLLIALGISVVWFFASGILATILSSLLSP